MEMRFLLKICYRLIYDNGIQYFLQDKKTEQILQIVEYGMMRIEDVKKLDEVFLEGFVCDFSSYSCRLKLEKL